MIVVTGASGHLGSCVAAELIKNGFEVTGIDVAPPARPPEVWVYRPANLANPADVKAGLTGAEAIVHCASLHPWKPYSDDQYLDSNLKGTWHLYRAAAELGVSKIVLTSSIAAMGYANIPPESWPVSEESQFPLHDLYGYTKRAQEDIAKLFADLKKIQTLALRPPGFFPVSPLDLGKNLTANFSVARDMAAAHVAAIRVLLGQQQTSEPLKLFEPIFVTNALPYRPEDASLLGPAKNNLALVRKYWPDAADWLIRQGFQGRTLNGLFNLTKAKRLLNWQPTYSFEQWLTENLPVAH